MLDLVGRWTSYLSFFFFNDTATTEIYTLSLHDALPIFYKTADGGKTWSQVLKINDDTGVSDIAMDPESPDTLYAAAYRSEEHTSELQSQSNLVCRLLLEKKKINEIEAKSRRASYTRTDYV